MHASQNRLSARVEGAPQATYGGGDGGDRLYTEGAPSGVACAAGPAQPVPMVVADLNPSHTEVYEGYGVPERVEERDGGDNVELVLTVPMGVVGAVRPKLTLTESYVVVSASRSPLEASG